MNLRDKSVSGVENTDDYYAIELVTTRHTSIYSSIISFVVLWELYFHPTSVDGIALIFNDALLHSINMFVLKQTSKPRSFHSKNLIFQKKRALVSFKRSKLATDYFISSELGAKRKLLVKSDYKSYINETERTLSSNPCSLWTSTK